MLNFTDLNPQDYDQKLKFFCTISTKRLDFLIVTFCKSLIFDKVDAYIRKYDETKYLVLHISTHLNVSESLHDLTQGEDSLLEVFSHYGKLMIALWRMKVTALKVLFFWLCIYFDQKSIIENRDQGSQKRFRIFFFSIIYQRSREILMTLPGK